MVYGITSRSKLSEIPKAVSCNTYPELLLIESELSSLGQNGRGIVIKIYLDDENPSGSTTALLHELEWKTGVILK
jgi:hypothetical protein